MNRTGTLARENEAPPVMRATENAMKRWTRDAIAMAMSVALLAPAYAADPLTKDVGTEWTWLTDYVYFYSEWTLNTDACQVEVGAGMKIAGKPRGSKHIFTGTYQFTTYGIGAIHVRAVGDSKSCRVRLHQGSVGAVPVLRTDY